MISDNPGSIRGWPAHRWRWVGGGLFAAVIFALEAGLRISGYGDPRPEELALRDGSLCVRAYSQTVFDELQNASYTYNRFGFRGTDWPAPRPPGGCRIAFLGDSFTFGAGVAERETLPALTALELRRRWNVPVEAVNLGMGGTNTQQQAIIARTMLPIVTPDLVVLTVIVNDGEVLPWNPDPYETGCVPVTAAKAADLIMLRHLYLYRPLHAWLGDDFCQGPRRCPVAFFQGGNILARCFRESLRRIAEEAAKQKAPLLVTFYPRPNPAYLDGTLPGEDSSIEQLREITAALDLRFLDLSPAFKGYSIYDLKVPADAHPNGLANRLAAKLLAGELGERWPCGPPGGAPEAVPRGITPPEKSNE